MRGNSALTLFLLCALTGSVAGPAPAKPNVVLITLDTVRADRMGFLGSKKRLTPNLDALALKSVVFERAYSQAPLTPVSHATILTGTYPPFHGVRDFGDRLPASLPFLPDLLHSQGYRTGAFVSSIILDPKNGFASGFERGFDLYDAGFHRQKTGERREASVERRGEVTLSHALEWLEKNQQGPFFLWLHLWDAHDPYNAPEPLRARFPGAPYNACIAYVDATAGKLLDYLRERGLYRDALIAVAADHGESLGEHGENQHGVFLYDSTIHVPLLIKFPGNRFAGQRVSSRVSLADLAPTLLDALGIAAPAAMQGQSVLPLIAATSPRDRPVYSESQFPQRAYGWSPLSALRSGHYLYVHSPQPELYDLSQDAAERVNLYSRNRPLASRLDGQLENFLKRVTLGAPKTAQGGLDPRIAEKLSALGYVAGNQAAKASGIDPKSRIAVANDMHDALLAIEDGRESSVIPALERATRTDPQNQSVYYYLGLAYSRKGEYAKAVAPLHRAVELEPDAMIAQYELAIALYETGDLKTAAGHLEIVVDQRPDWSDARYSLASIYARSGRPEDAAKNLAIVLRESPDHYRANLLLGRMLFLNGNYSDALPYLEKAAEVQSDSSEAHVFLADDYDKLNRAADAARERADAAHLKPARKP